ncbi:MAG: CocE/NonD family hydrolase [Bacteroidetes bacterium]|nr:CocE/NonD family hydrolase [Bacteroidota bacterium]
MKKHSIFVILFLIICQLSLAQVLTPITDSITMRDGKKLAADIYLPDTGKTYPVILIQTPYNRLYYRMGLPLQIGKDIKNSPYAVVIVDWRCFYGSAAACKALPERGKDGYDVIDWICKQSWSDGKIGTWGPSALGKIQYLTAKEQHPNHTCAVPIVAGSQFNYQEYFPNGVLRTEYVDQLDALGYNMKNTLLQHPYYDIWWQYVENANMYPDKIKVPMFLIGGWFDHNIDLMFDLFDTLVKTSDPSVRDLHKFLVGPWSHNSVGKKEVGEIEFPFAEGASDSFTLLFFDYWLRGAKNGWPINKKFILDDISEFAQFQKFDNIENYKKSLYFEPISLYLGFGKHMIPSLDPSADSILLTYNPKNPSPTIGGATLRTDLKQGPWNIRDNALRRNDYAMFIDLNGMPKNMGMLGKPKVDLYVSSDRKDTDFAVRLCLHNGDLDSTHIIISDGIYRMRFRNGFRLTDTQSMNKDSIYKITIELPPLFIYPFNSNQNYKYISLIISCSNYPRFDINLNNGQDLYTAGDTLSANNYLYFGKKYLSRIYFDGYYYLGAIEESNSKSLIKTYPNPTQNNLFIDPQNLQPPFTYSIFDLQGKELMHGEVKSNAVFSLDISALNPQVYFIRVKSETHTSVSKFIKVD